MSSDCDDGELFDARSCSSQCTSSAQCHHSSPCRERVDATCEPTANDADASVQLATSTSTSREAWRG